MALMSPRTDVQRPVGGVLLVATWSWLITASATGAIGLVAVYRNPNLVEVSEFSLIYEPLGLSHRTMVTAFLAMPLLFALVVGIAIAVRKRGDRGALVLAVGLVAMFYFSSGSAVGIEAQSIREALMSAAFVLFATFLVSFPTGTFVPRWSIASPALALAASFARPSLPMEARVLLTTSPSLRDVVLGHALPVLSGVFAIALAAQVVRYRSLATEMEQRQTRWIVFGVLGLLVPFMILLALISAGVSAPLLVGLGVALTALGSYLLPVALAIAVFRYHLYDIDRLISRTVSYGLVAGTVAGVYALPVVLFPALVKSDEDLFIAAATLVVAGIFNPLRRRIQRWTDARFNRSRFDAGREIEELGTRLRDEIRPAGVVDGMIEVVDRTLEPTGRAVWIRRVGGS